MTNAGVDGEATAKALEDAALELVDRDGVLTGLNLREVADHAGVNRGLIYHYFGSRRDLLRSALKRRLREATDDLRLDPEPATFGQRLRRVLSGVIRRSSVIRLMLLLALDGDPNVRLMPDLDRTQRMLLQDQLRGKLAQDVDTVALHAVMHALSVGYVTERELLAAEFGLGVRELDDRVMELLDRLTRDVDS